MAKKKTKKTKKMTVDEFLGDKAREIRSYLDSLFSNDFAEGLSTYVGDEKFELTYAKFDEDLHVQKVRMIFHYSKYPVANIEIFDKDWRVYKGKINIISGQDDLRSIVATTIGWAGNWEYYISTTPF